MDNIIIFIIIIFWIYSIVKKFQKKKGRKNTIKLNSNPILKFIDDLFLTIFNSNNLSKKNMPNVKKHSPIKTAAIVIGTIILFFIVINIFVVIPTGFTGVQSIFGKVQDRELSSGLHIVNPLVSIEKMKIQTEEYTMSVTQGEGKKSGADQISALTNEGLPIDLDITVFYRLQEDKASDVYRELSVNYQEKIIRPEIRSAIREVVAKYSAKEIYSEKRQEVALAIKDRLITTIEPRGITVEDALLRNITLPAKLSASIQEKLQAEQESQRYEFILQKEEKEADRKRVEAAGQRDSQKIIDESLTPRYLEYLYINELKDRAGTIYVPIGNDGLPLFKGI
ncbi:MAG: prohibitin family protein [Candidatus Moranbacteria bacterium]|nr:prohibitin family protein [Candidatus Moranbacteria bacterium]